MPNRNSIQHYVLLLAFAFFALILSLIPTALSIAEEITLTTYYPSPYGVYSELRLHPKASATCGANMRGLMYYDDDADRFQFCAGTPADWIPIGGSLWTLAAGTRLYPNDLTWNVGVGTTNPGRKLEISGNSVAHGAAIRFSGQPANTDSAVLEVMDPGGINAAWSLGNKGTNNELFKIYSGTGGNDRLTIDVNAGTTILNPSGGNTQIGFISAPPAPARLSVSGSVAIGGIPFITNNPPADSLIVSGNVGIGTENPGEKLEVNGDIKLSGAAATHRITNVANPINDQDVATKAYVVNALSSGDSVAFRYVSGALCPSVTGVTLRGAIRGGSLWGFYGAAASDCSANYQCLCLYSSR